MIGQLAAWWLALFLIGCLSWPLTALVFPNSVGRGYAYARALGILLLSYLLWLANIVGLLDNSPQAIWAIAVGVAVAGIIAGIHQRAVLWAVLRRDWRHLIVVELLFMGVLALYAGHRAHDAAIWHTEQPMDMAFLSALRRSPRLPPNDPWLAGFSINYYYLGYLTVALLSRLTATPSSVAYNLGLAHTLALAVVAGHGLLSDWLDTDRSGVHEAHLAAVTPWAIVGSLGIALAGNLEGVLELFRAWGLGADGFYRWLGVAGLAEAPRGVGWLPQDTWWWRASRIISDANILGRTPTIITEFPAFSLVLGDLHPHVMAWPYFVMSLALCHEIYRAGRHGLERGWRLALSLLAWPWLIGALGFLNSWDLPPLLVAAAGAFALGSYRRDCQGRWVRAVALMALWLIAASLLLYAPFYAGLSSTVQGIGLAYYAKTPLKHYLLCLGLWLLPIAAEALPHAVREARQVGRNAWLARYMRVWVIVWLLPWLVTGIWGGWGRLLIGLGVWIATGPWLLLFLSGMLALLWVALCDALRAERLPSAGYLLSMGCALLGLGLTYAAEFVYLRDAFDTRMNTMFKLYYQAWTLLGVAAVCVAWRLRPRGRWGKAALALSTLVLCASLGYPIAAAYSKAGGYRGSATLDGTAYLKSIAPAEYAAYRWLDAHATPFDVLAEAPGQEYDSAHNRLSAWTGVPSVLGWAGHERQWRGNIMELRRREQDLKRIYTSASVSEVLLTLQEYGVTYLYVGPHEAATYALAAERLEWYASFLETAFGQEGVRLYRVP